MEYDVANEHLDIDEENTAKFLKGYSIDEFYNEDEKAVLYDAETLHDNFSKFNVNLTCQVDKTEEK